MDPGVSYAHQTSMHQEEEDDERTRTRTRTRLRRSSSSCYSSRTMGRGVVPRGHGRGLPHMRRLRQQWRLATT